MAYNGSGTFVRVHNWTSDAANGIDINAAEMDAEDNGFAAGLTLAVTRDGQGQMAADFVPSVASTFNIGTAAKPWLNIQATNLNGTSIASLPTSQVNIGNILFPPTAAEIAAATALSVSTVVINPYIPSIPMDIRRYGGGNSQTAATNRTALTYAIAVAGGSDYGYGQAAVQCNFPDGGTYNIASGGDFVIPVNMSLVGPSSLIGVTLTLSGTDHIVWRNPANYGGSHTQTQYWPYMAAGAKNVVFTGGYGVQVITMIGAVFEDCVFSSSSASNPSIELRNTYSYWTERTSFTRCFFGGGGAGDSILFNGTRSLANPGVADGSFAYTQFDACVVACSGTMNLMRIIDGASVYGCKFGFRGNFTSTGGVLQGAMFCLDSTLNVVKISEGVFDVRVESGTGLSYLFYISQSSQFWDNKGQISLPSYDFDSIEINGSFRANSVEVTGASLYNPFFQYSFNANPTINAVSATLLQAWMGSTTAYAVVFPDGEQRSVTITQGALTASWSTPLTAAQTSALFTLYYPVYQGQQITSRIVNSVKAREPVEMKVIDLFTPGVMTAAANTDPTPAAWVLGQLPLGWNTLLRCELSCTSGTAGDTDSVWHLDIRQGLQSGQTAYAGTNTQFSMFIPDGVFVANGTFAIYAPNLSNYSSSITWQPVITSQPTNVGASHNNGTGPTNLRCRLYYY